MALTIQTFLAAEITAATTDLITAVEDLPEDKRGWKPLGKARTALDQAAECAILHGFTANLLTTRKFPEESEFNMADFQTKKDELGKDWDGLKALLVKNTDLVAETIKGVPDSDLEIEIPMPWGSYTVAQTMLYPYWNAKYHEGQTNYIGSMLAE